MVRLFLFTFFMIALGITADSPVQAEDLIYVAVEPCRIVDTREAGGAIPANNFRNFRVSGTIGELAAQGGKTDCLDPKAGTGQKPLAISAYVIAVPSPGSDSGVLTAYPSDQLPPPVGSGSTVNFSARQIIGNTTNITLCDPSGSCPTDGEFAILARSTSQHVVIDVQGYFYKITLGKCSANAPTRFVDNGDGTICDNETGLMWEKKDAADGEEDFSNPHDADNLYTWANETTGGMANPDGTAFTDFLARLNNLRIDRYDDKPFAGYTDWKLPTVAQLLTIRDCSFVPPCIDPIFGPTGGSYPRWTATDFNPQAEQQAVCVSFYSDWIGYYHKTIPNLVRAVRDGR